MNLRPDQNLAALNNHESLIILKLTLIIHALEKQHQFCVNAAQAHFCGASKSQAVRHLWGSCGIARGVEAVIQIHQLSHYRR